MRPQRLIKPPGPNYNRLVHLTIAGVVIGPRKERVYAIVGSVDRQVVKTILTLACWLSVRHAAHARVLIILRVARDLRGIGSPSPAIPLLRGPVTNRRRSRNHYAIGAFDQVAEVRLQRTSMSRCPRTWTYRM